MALEVMLRAHAQGDADSLARVEKALDAMRDGGIYDQLGGGFHRYSTDERWLVPHFEKMLYDNALLVRLYTDAWRATREPRYAETVRETLGYVEREMRAANGLFFSTQDADSEGEEGKFFVWTPEEVRAVLGEEDARAAMLYFGVTEGGNFEDTGASVLHVNRPLRAVAASLEKSEGEIAETLARAKAKLFDAREKRIKPFRDEKIIATWNGLMIGAFAAAGAAMEEPRWIEIARNALAGARAELWCDGALRRIAKDGRTRGEGFLEDYADLANAAIDLYEASLDPGALSFARELARAADALFWDERDGAYYFARENASDLIVRAKDAYDNAVPSGTSSMARALLRLGAYEEDAQLTSHAERTIRALSSAAVETPLGFGHLLGAIDLYLSGPTEVIVVAEPGDPESERLLNAARRCYVPNLAMARAAPGETSAFAGAAPRHMKDGRASAYVCRSRTCSAPVTTPEELEALLAEASPG
jgi:uncharacterized protein